MNARRAIQRAAVDLGLVIEEMTWEPVGPAAEMCGPGGGWRVVDSGGRDYLGYNCTEVIDDMRSSVKYRMGEKEADRHFRRGVRAAAKEKDGRIAELLALIPPSAKLNGKAADALREFKNLILHQFVIALYRETDHQAHLRYKTPDDKPIPPLCVGDCWTAIDCLMRPQFGDNWRDAAL